MCMVENSNGRQDDWEECANGLYMLLELEARNCFLIFPASELVDGFAEDLPRDIALIRPCLELAKQPSNECDLPCLTGSLASSE